MMKKKIITSFILITAMALLLFSCEEEVTTTSLRIRMTDRISTSRDMYSPSGEGLDIYGYIIEGKGPNDQTLSLTTTSPQIDINGLMIGTWNIVVTGVNQQGTPMATGEATFQLSTQSNTVDITVDTLYGEGRVQFGLFWGPEVFNGISVEMVIRDVDGTERDVSASVTVSESTSSALFTDSLHAGVYEVQYSILSNSVVIAGGIDIVRILDNLVTVAEVTIEVQKLTPEATGLTITENLGSRIEGEIVGIESVESPMENYTATFSPIGTPPSPYHVTWYLDGTQFETGESVTFSTHTGPHRLDAIARGTGVLTAGADTHNFRISVGDTKGVPALVASYEDPALGAGGEDLSLNSVSAGCFLLDGNLAVAGAGGVQVCRVDEDAVQVLNTYTSNGQGYQNDPFPTSGITTLAVDSTDSMLFTSNSSTGVVVAYSYDELTGALTKIDAAGPSDQPWGTNISNIVVDQVNDHLLFLDRDDDKMYAIHYASDGFTPTLSTPLGQYFAQIEDGEFISISDARDTLFVASPSNNTFHTYGLTYDYQGIPILSFKSNDLFSSALGTVSRGYIVAGKLHLLSDSGLHLFSYNPSLLKWEHVERIGTSTLPMSEVMYDSTFSQGWVFEEDTDLRIHPFEVVLGVPMMKEGSTTLPSLTSLCATLSPKGNYMAVTGSSSLRLYRLNDL